MRLKSVTAADHARAMAEIRASLGDDAVIVASQELKDGRVRVTAAVEQDDVDLAALLAPGEAPAEPPWLKSLAEHHELTPGLHRRLQEHIAGLAEVGPAAALAQALNHLFRFTPVDELVSGRLVLTGPPGVGKTASIAKLAARAVLNGRTAAVITTDVERAGGLEQLGALLEPLGLQPTPAPDGPELKRAVAAAATDTVLIDSPGFNPFRSADIGRISALIEASRAEPVLVLGGGLAVSDCGEIGQTYAALGAGRLLVTKLDASRRLGGVLAAAEGGLAFAGAGIGPTIGQGLCPLSAAGLARLMLHGQAAAARSDAPAKRRRALLEEAE